MLTLILALIAVSWASPMQTPQKLNQKPVRVVTCTRVVNSDRKVTSMTCGRDENGDELVLDIPETYATFPRGEVFKIEILPDGHSRFAVKQPKGSIVILSPPCPKDNPCAEGRRRRAPCNPELPRR